MLFYYFIAITISRFQNLTLIIENAIINPDGFSKNAITINGTMPGPEIRTKIGTKLNIKIINKSNEEFSLHLHGLDQFNNYHFDGVPHLTQEPIFPNSEFIYNVIVGNQPGTYWYHSHIRLQSDTAHGALIIEDDFKELKKLSLDYDEERVIILGDYYHKSDLEIIEGLNSTDFKWIGNPNSLTFNGQSYYKNNLNINQIINTIKVDFNKVYRIRIICTTSLSFLNFAIKNHILTIIEVDGIYTHPLNVKSIKINSGQRVSFLLKTYSYSKDDLFLMESRALYRPSPNNGLAILQYGDRKLNDQVINTFINKTEKGLVKDDDIIIEEPSISNYYYKENGHFYPLKKPKKTIILNAKQETLNNKTKWLLGNNLVNYKDKKTFIKLIKNQYYRLIIQLYSTPNGVCDQHPFHFHGHPFYVMGSGTGRYNLNYETRYSNPILRDTVTAYPDKLSFGVKILPNSPCGWLELVFKSKNSGKWLFHCHISAHMIMGMETVFYY